MHRILIEKAHGLLAELIGEHKQQIRLFLRKGSLASQCLGLREKEQRQADRGDCLEKVSSANFMPMVGRM